MLHSISTRWAEDYHFVSSIDNKQVDFDATTLGANHVNGVSPKTILLSGLSGCTGMDIVALLKKFKVEFSDFSVDVQGELTEEHPKYYHKIHMVYKVKIDEADREKMEKAVNLSVERYCGVHAMLSKAATITHDIIYL